MQSLRISLPAINALEASPDARDYSLLADEDNVLIKEHSRGSSTIDDLQTLEVSHNLNYLPHFYSYAEISSGRFQISNGYNLFGSFRSFVDSSKLYIENVSGVNDSDVRYFIFYDDVPE